MQRAGFQHIGFTAPVALVFWIAVLESGVHATIAGVILGALTPAVAAVPPGDFAHPISRLSGELTATVESRDRNGAEMLAANVEELGRQSESPLDRAERLFHPWSSYGILPLFALANSGVVLTRSSIGDAFGSPVLWGIALGLLIGKPLGISLFAWSAARAGIAMLPDGIRWRDVIALGLIAGIGFTVSIFITNLAFAEEPLIMAAKIGIFAVSLIAATGGWMAARQRDGRAAQRRS
jgi:NhaA family Na+:H+ antiporter